MRLKVFIDSSVLLAAALSLTGAGNELIKQGLQGHLDIYFSDYVFGEVERNLWRKNPDGIESFQFIKSQARNIVNPPEALAQMAAQTVEPKDAPIIAAAIMAGATYIVSYDRRHLVSKRVEIEAAFHIIATTPRRGATPPADKSRRKPVSDCGVAHHATRQPPCWRCWYM